MTTLTVTHDADTGFFFVVNADGERLSGGYPMKKTANRRLRQLEEAAAPVRWSDDPEMDAALCEDAAKLEALGQDPGPTLAEIGLAILDEAYEQRLPAFDGLAVAALILTTFQQSQIEYSDALVAITEEALADIAASRKADTREQWLTLAAELIRPILKARTGLDMTPYRVTCGWPSKGGNGKTKRTLGEAWHHSASADGHAEIFITPREDNRRTVLAILAHEIIHTCLPAGTGHKRPFCDAAGKMGFVAPFTQLHPTDDLWAWADEIIEQLPCYPHARLGVSGIALGAPKPQTNRQLKAVCNTCEFTFRASKKWLEAAPELHCPDPTCEGHMVCEGLGDEDGEDEE